MPHPALHAVFQSTALAMVTYASPAWWGFTNAADRNRLEAFIRRAVKHGYCADSTASLSSLCDKADQTLFANIITNSTHRPSPHLTSIQSTETLLYPSPRPLLSTSNGKPSVLDENNFFYGLLYRDILSFKSTV